MLRSLKYLLLVFAIAAIFSATSLHAGDDLTMPEGAVVSTDAANEETPAAVLHMGAGLGIYSSEFAQAYGGSILGYGFNAGFMRQLGQSGLYWGGDFGLYFWGFEPNPNIRASTRGAVSIHFLPTLVYRFAPLEGVPLRPFFGVALGPNLYVVRETQAGAGGATPSSTTPATNFYFELLARPGIDWEFSRTFRLSGEIKIGTLNWSFITMPQINLSVNL